MNVCVCVCVCVCVFESSKVFKLKMCVHLLLCILYPDLKSFGYPMPCMFIFVAWVVEFCGLSQLSIFFATFD